MTKQEFIAALRKSLIGLPPSDVEERLDFYTEMIADRMEEGLSEQEAVAAIGTVEEIVLQVVDEYSVPAIIKQRIRTRRPMSGFVVTLLIMGFPVWFSLLAAAFAVVFSLYVSLWAVIVSLWATFAALAASTLGGLVGGTLLACTGHLLSGLAIIAGSLICAGLAIFSFFGCKAATKGAARLTKSILLAIKKACMRKEAAQ